MNIFIDKIVYMIDLVSEKEFQELKYKLDELELSQKIVSVSYQMGKSISEYRYNLHIGQGEGAIFVGWQHNASKGDFVKGEKMYTMKVEYNPTKLLEWHITALKALQAIFVWHIKKITTIDFATDIEVHKDSLFVFCGGKEENRYRGDRYYGYKSNHGHLKVYDKKRERMEKAKINVFPEDEMYRELTRIEYTWKVDKGITFDMFKMVNPLDIAKEYQIRIVDDINGLNVQPEIKACIIAILWGQMQVKQFRKHIRPKIEKALSNSEELALGSLIAGSWKNTLNIIHKHLYEL